jgi:hypothetical protein
MAPVVMRVTLSTDNLDLTPERSVCFAELTV